MLDVNAVTSRNQETLYKYFLVRSNNSGILSGLPLQEYKMYVFQSAVTSKRGKSILSGTNVLEVTAIEERLLESGTFGHHKYTNQRNEPLPIYYRDVIYVDVPITSSRNENIKLYELP